jgi:hypothetical protein
LHEFCIPYNGDGGDGNTSDDAVITGDLTMDLRAERSGKGSDRIYTLTAECTDSAANRTSGQVDVLVPHDRRKKK